MSRDSEEANAQSDKAETATKATQARLRTRTSGTRAMPAPRTCCILEARRRGDELCGLHLQRWRHEQGTQRLPSRISTPTLPSAASTTAEYAERADCTFGGNRRTREAIDARCKVPGAEQQHSERQRTGLCEGVRQCHYAGANACLDEIKWRL